MLLGAAAPERVAGDRPAPAEADRGSAAGQRGSERGAVRRRAAPARLVRVLGVGEARGRGHLAAPHVHGLRRPAAPRRRGRRARGARGGAHRVGPGHAREPERVHRGALFTGGELAGALRPRAGPEPVRDAERAAAAREGRGRRRAPIARGRLEPPRRGHAPGAAAPGPARVPPRHGAPGLRGLRLRAAGRVRATRGDGARRRRRRPRLLPARRRAAAGLRPLRLLAGGPPLRAAALRALRALPGRPLRRQPAGALREPAAVPRVAQPAGPPGLRPGRAGLLPRRVALRVAAPRLRRAAAASGSARATRAATR